MTTMALHGVYWDIKSRGPPLEPRWRRSAEHQSAKNSGRYRRVYHLGSKGQLLGVVTAANVREAMGAAIEKFGIPERDRIRALVRESGD